MMQDLRFAVRMARREPGTTLAIFLALALGIGGATAIFSVVDAAMLRPLPLKDGGRALVRIYSTTANSNEDDVSLADYLDWKHDVKSFSSMAAFATSQATLSGSAAAERAVCLYTEWTLLPTLGIAPLAGRNFRADENREGQTDEAILSWEFWQSHYGGRSVVGQQMMLDEHPYRIIGVMPRGFNVLGHRDLLLPLTLDGRSTANQRGYHQYQVVARLAPGVTLEHANAELSRYAEKTARIFPVENRGVGARAVRLADSLSGEGLGSAQKHVRAALIVLLLAILCVLAIACVNVANINLMRALAREREIAVRVAIGATRSQLFRQMLSESVLLALAASAAGLLIAAALVRLLARLPLNAVPRLEETTIDWRVFLFALALGCLTGVGFGLVPAIRASGFAVAHALRQSGVRSTGSRLQNRYRELFVAAEAALAVLLLIECGLFVKSFSEATAIDPGFATNNLLTFYLSLPPTRYGHQHPANTEPLLVNVISQLEQVPGVVSAAIAEDLPLSGTANGNGILVEGHAQSAHVWDVPAAITTDVSPGYFRTLQVKLLDGSHFAERGADVNEVMVNRTFARSFFPGQNAVGRRIAVSLPHPAWKQIVGVVADVPPGELEQKIPPEVFFRVTSLTTPWLGMVARVNGDPLVYIAPVRAAIRKVDPGIAVFLPRSAQQMISKQLFWRNLQTWLVTAFAVLAVSLAAVGAYAVIAYSIRQRVNEMGVRVALGAPAGVIRRMVLWQGARPALIGIAVGCACGWGAARMTANLLFGTDGRDAKVFVIAALVLVLVSIAASIIPAWRAARVEPWKALRHE